MNKDEGHLTIGQIQSLLAISVEELTPEESKLWEDAELHLTQCTACQTVLAMERKVQTRLRDLRATSPGERSAGCPSSVALYELAGGQIYEEEAEALIKHIVDCDNCSAEFRQATTDLDSEPTMEETALVLALKTSRPDWQIAFAHKLAESFELRQESHLAKSPTLVPRRFQRLVWALGAATAILAVLFVVAMMWHSSPQYAANLLASAYSEQRTMELRIPGAEYSPLRITRGAGSSRLDRPRALLAAEELIGRKLAERRDDPEWLEAKARADLVDGNYEAALKTLSSLPESAPVLIDLATAYFERGEATNGPVDFGNAVEAFGKALVKAPEDRIALYNRAIVCERISLHTQAIDDWERYLKIDGKTKWAAEAREHLRELKDKQKQRERSRTEPLLTPGEFARVAGEGQDSYRKLDSRVEDYLSVSLGAWLTDAQQDHGYGKSGANETEAALAELANMAKRNHGDAWLEDLLADTFPSFHRAVSDLAKATVANEGADAISAQRYASEAENLFRTLPRANGAGELRAKFESMFASKIDQDGAECLKNSARAESEAAGRSYLWLEAQFLLEEGSCQWLLGNLGAARQKYLAAAETAKQSGYQALYLRSQDHLSGIEAEAGNYESAWRITSAALGQFWSGNYADVRGYNLYYNLYELSRMRSQPYLQMAAWRDGVALSESSSDVAQRAMAHSLLANTAWATHDGHTAKEELNKAAALFSASPRSRATRLAQLETESRRAMMETALGQAEQAVARLRPLEPAVQALSDRYLAILFYSCLGDAELERHNPAGADSALRSAVALAESQLASLKEEESRVEWSAKSDVAYRDLVEMELEKGNGAKALAIWESYRGAPMRPASGLVPTRKNNDARTNVRGQTVVYALLPRSLAIWVYDERGSKVFRIERQPGIIEDNVAAFERICGNSRSDQASLIRYGRDLYRDLIAPVESFLSWNSDLVIEPDDALAGLAFEALIDQHGHYLGEKTPVTLSLGVYYDRKSRPSSPITPNSSALVVAIRNSSAVLNLSLSALPDSEAEGESIAHKFREARLLTGYAANDDALLAALMDSEVFHFSGHALSSPRRSGLLLSNSLLRASAFSASRVSHLQLAVLSACASEDGSNGRVTDGDSSVRTLLSRGVPHVVASRWEVDSRTTSQFMNLFYDRVLSGESVPRAVHIAQFALRANRETAHPFYWCAFAAFGRT